MFRMPSARQVSPDDACHLGGFSAVVASAKINLLATGHATLPTSIVARRSSGSSARSLRNSFFCSADMPPSSMFSSRASALLGEHWQPVAKFCVF